MYRKVAKVRKLVVGERHPRLLEDEANVLWLTLAVKLLGVHACVCVCAHMHEGTYIYVYMDILIYMCV